MLKTYKIREKEIALEYGEYRYVVSRIKRKNNNKKGWALEYTYNIRMELNINYNASDANWIRMATCDIENDGVMVYLDDVIDKLKAIDIQKVGNQNYDDIFDQRVNENKDKLYIVNLKKGHGLEHFRFIKSNKTQFDAINNGKILVKYELYIGIATDFETCENGFLMADLDEKELEVIKSFVMLFKDEGSN